RRQSARRPPIELAVPRSTPKVVRGTATSGTGAGSAGIEAVTSDAASAVSDFVFEATDGCVASEAAGADVSAAGCSAGVVATDAVVGFGAADGADSLLADRGGEAGCGCSLVMILGPDGAGF